ncbi:FIST signal transduction protein [Chitinimonas lacunae]|uniref:FIST signal transduction protein n=1 Tax=Chitinimonas lacunae TaxID=1963018 RepID=A0ABV8MQH8_9NEIS
MRAQSLHTLLSDPYRAGLALGEGLAPLAPEVVLLFCSIHFSDFHELLAGFYAGLGHDEVVLLGNTGDGFYESGHTGDYGAAALGLNSDGAVRWRLAVGHGVGSDPEGTTRACLAELQAEETPTLAYLLSDFRTDASRLEAAFDEDLAFPVVGGFAADANQMEQCFLFAGKRVLRDAVVTLAAYGPLRYDIGVGNALTVLGNSGMVESAAGTELYQIDGLAAMDFIERETGKPVLQSDRGVVALTVIDPHRPSRRRLRAIVPDFSSSHSTVGLYGGIETGRSVQVCLADPEALLGEVRRLAEQATTLDFRPVAALIVSCIGRKAILDSGIAEEVAAITRALPGSLAVAGFPSFGEIGPLKEDGGYSRTLFHNMTYVLLLIGS